MPTFAETFQDFCAGLADLPGESFGDRVNALGRKLQDMTPEEAHWAAEPLIAMLARAPQPRISVLGILGELLCRGVNFWGFLPHYLAALGRNLALAAQVETAIRPLLPPGKRLADLPPAEGQAVVDRLPEPARSHPSTWAMIDFYLGPAMPLFQQVKGVRQLARAMGLLTAWLADTSVGVEWLPKLPEFFEAADEPLPDQAPAIDAALAEVRRQSAHRPPNREAMQQSLRPIFEVTTFVPPVLHDHAAAELARIAAAADPDWATELAGVAGAFSERGANPEPGADALIAGLPRLLDPVIAFVEACRALPTKKDESAVQTHVEAVGRKMPEARRALDAISGYCLGTIAHLARCPAARLRHGRNADLLAKLNVVRWDTGNTGFLWKMLQVLDEELVILAPAFKLGWRVRIAGVADNFQLHALIAGHLIGQVDDGKYPGAVGTHDRKEPDAPGVPISPRATATQMNAPCTGREPGFSSSLQLWNWTALHKDATLPANPIGVHEHWIWNEGVPADIAPFAGTRVVLLGPSTIQRNWNGGRIFPFMEGSFKLVETMTPETVADWLRRIAAREGVA
jgi:hypothetical protein